jgi:hypothetical protein
MSKQGSAGKRKHLTIIPQKFEIIRSVGSGISWREVVDSHNMGLSSICDVKKEKDQLWSFMESSEIVKDLLKWQAWTEPKLMQLDKALYKWFTTVCLEWKMCDWDYNWNGGVFLWWNKNDWQVHILWGQ